jgi:hypothetical protein
MSTLFFLMLLLEYIGVCYLGGIMGGTVIG